MECPLCGTYQGMGGSLGNYCYDCSYAIQKLAHRMALGSSLTLGEALGKLLTFLGKEVEDGVPGGVPNAG